jgi:adenosylhomocysteine nucleosidase
MPNTSRVGIIAALRREIRDLVTGAEVRHMQSTGRKLYQLGDVSIACAGIGPEAARRATDAMIQHVRPELIVSVGFAGALDPALRIGDIVAPRTVIDMESGQRFSGAYGEGVLVSATAIATSEQKRSLHERYRALAVDMEAAAVAERATAHGIQFVAMKSISDTADATLPDFSRFVRRNGEFATISFLVHTVFHPALWPEIRKLAVNTGIAAQSLTSALRLSVMDGSFLRAADSNQAINSR